MDLLIPEIVSRQRLPAPALSRGLAILAALGEGRSASLEEISTRLRLPKASTLRFLATLIALGLLRKNPDKTYEAMVALRPVIDPAERFLSALEGIMANLCADAGCTVEWYEPTPEGLTLKRQMHPDCEVRVQARPGFLREWHGEFEAVTRLGLALAPNAPGILRPKRYVTDGHLKSLRRAEATELLTDARQRRAARDTAFNDNGVRRAAVAVMPSGVFAGVLALAEVHRFGPSRRTKDPLQLLTQSITPFNS